MAKKIRSRRRPIVNGAAPTKQPTTDETSPDPTIPQVSVETAPSSDSAPVAVDRAKLLQMLMLQFQGKTQVEIGKFFGCCDRTIRNWCKQANELKIGLKLDVKAEAEVSDMLLRFAARESELIKWKRQAEADGDSRMMMDCAKELRKLNSERIKQLKNLGLFDGYDMTSNGTEDDADTDAVLMMSLLGDVLAPQGPDEGDQHDHSA
ncbi:MAG: helix-turn-helix domain-containing protein [Rhodospirillaceae bacterium]|nr:helix-turn-helix domain-containing protein [Rhodospirillaceae bacterium]